MTDPVPFTSVSEPISEYDFERQMQERRSQTRILAFCQVMDLERNLVGVSFDLTQQGICLSLPNSWPSDSSFTIILKRADQPALPEITVEVTPVWRKMRNANFDEVGAKILTINSPADFETFLQYCNSVGPSGLFEED